MNELSQRLTNLSSAKLELLARLTRDQRGSIATNSGAPKRQTISRRCDSSSPAPLTFAQERQWFLHQMDPQNPVYHAPLSLRLRGPLNVAALEVSLTEIIRRHEILRTTFPSIEGRPLQTVSAASPCSLLTIDLQLVAEREREQQAQKLILEEISRPFDLAQGPLLRTLLVRLDEEEHLLALTMHHIITDGWSMGLMINELSSLYEASSQNQVLSLAEPHIQYADYAVWQREWLEGAVLEQQLSYWKEKLQGAPALLELPTDHPRPPIQSFAGAKRQLRLSASTSEALATVARQHDATLFMTLLSAFAVLMGRYSGASDLVVGTPIANRTQPETEALMGFFVNTLALRVDMSGNPTFAELLGRVREQALGAYEHQDVPFEKLVEVLQPDRSLSHTPLFQVMFMLQETVEPRRVNGLEMELLAAPEGVAKFDLVLEARQESQSIALSLEYNSELYQAETAERLLRNYEALVERLAKNANLQISELPVTSVSEREKILVEWNQTTCGYEDQKTVPELFEEQVRIAPERVAVDHEGEPLTYGELNRRANQLAHHLRSLGVGPDVIVGISVDQSADMAIGILGILKAGGAYLPLDPTYPRDRLQFMLEDSRASLLLTQKSLIDILPQTDARTTPEGPLAHEPVVLLDANRESIELQSDSNPGPITTPRNLAYVIYTSGSTGRPKGVMIEHRGVANLRTAQQNAFGVGTGSRVLQFSSFSFDASVWETVMALLTGGTLCFAGGSASLWDGSDATRVLRDQAITVVTLPPSLLAVLRSEDLPALQTIISAGESCSSEIAERWSVGRRFWNAYGPTETTVCATMLECSSDYPQGPPIGRPIANTQIYILDEFGNPTPLGVAGELHVASAGLARGYLNRPDLTAEKFIPNQFSQQPGSRLYRTGDLAVYLADGNIEYLGRLDHQVKVRGYRIELGEIESLLMAHEAVNLAAVKAHEYPSGEKRLVAYVVPVVGKVPDISELRAFIKEKLPEYMVPSVIMTMDALPLTPNGKVDKKALSAPEGRRTVADADYVAPQNEFEERIAAIWREALHVEKVGVNDNFFDLGGHSLLLLRIHTQLQQACNRDLALITLFKYPTIGALARHLSEGSGDRSAMEQAHELAEQRQQRAQKQRAALGQQRKSLSQRMVSV